MDISSKCVLKVDDINEASFSVDGQVQDDFFHNSGNSTFTFNFRSDNKKISPFHIIQKWAFTPSPITLLPSAKVTIDSKLYFIGSLFPISVSMTPTIVDGEIKYCDCIAKFAYSAISEIQ
jgi:hypothetical protein